MKSAIFTTLLWVALGLSILFYELDAIAPENAFFIISAALILYAGHQFIKREGMPFGEALVDIFAKPPAQPRGRAAHYAFLIGSFIGIAVLIQTVASGTF